MRRRVYLFCVLSAAAALVLWLSTRTRQAPRLPADEAHAAFAGPAACIECHRPEGPVPRSRNHPLGQDCLRCHGRR